MYQISLLFVSFIWLLSKLGQFSFHLIFWRPFNWCLGTPSRRHRHSNGRSFQTPGKVFKHCKNCCAVSGHYGCLKCIYIHKKVDYCECQQFVQTRVFAAFDHWNLALTLSFARSEIFVKTFTDQSVEVQKITICVKAAQHIKPYLGKAYLKISNY